jgi:hypothetical protein
MGILVRTGRTGRTLLSLVTGAGIRISGIIRLTRGRLLGLLVLTLPAVGITLLTLPPGPLTIPAGVLTLLVLTLPAVGLPLLVLPLIPVALPLRPWSLPATGISLLMLPLLVLPLLVLPLLVLPLRWLTTPGVGISSGCLPPSLLTL